MSRIDDLIAEHCPDGVEYRTVGQAVDVVATARGVQRSRYGQGSLIPIVDQGQSLVAGHTDDRSLALPEGEYIVFGDHTRAVKWVDFTFAPGADGTKVLRSTDGYIPKFLYYAISNLDVQSRGYNRHWTVLRELRVPTPPLEVQREIVRILDTFTELEAELEAELLLRREQRVTVVSKEFVAQGATERVALGDIANQVVDPLPVEPSAEYVNLGVKWYGEGAFAREPKRGSEIKGKTLYRVRAGQFIYNRMFVTEGSFGLVTPEIAHGVVSNEFPVFDLDESCVLPEWLYLKFRDPYIVSVVAGEASGGTKSRRRWKEDQFKAFVIDLPPISVQRDVVRVHTRFMELESAIEEELAGRRLQFGYYRDRLLSLEEASS